MRPFSAIAVVAALVCSASIAAQGRRSTLYVDCAAPAGGSGSANSPFSTITSAVAAARTMTPPLRIAVAPGLCSQETLPIVLDIPSLELRGARTPTASDDERPDGNQSQDTIFEVASLSATGFVVAQHGVQITHLSIVGARPLGPDGSRPPILVPLGIRAIGVTGYLFDHLRIEGMGQAIRAEAARGNIRNNFLSGDNPIFVAGGPAATDSEVAITNNRMVYRVNCLPIAGGDTVGAHLTARINDNDFLTTYTNSGPTNPVALRISPFVGGSNATLDLRAANNFFGGPGKYAIMIHAGQPVRAPGATYTGALRIDLAQNVIDPAVAVRSVITFTNVRATILPCELNPELSGPACPMLPPTPVYAEYLTGALYDLRHTGELEGGLVDHPECHPYDKYPLGNRLIVNGVIEPYGSFFVVPGVPVLPACVSAAGVAQR